MNTKSNPGPIDCYAHAHPDEPIFVFRANDELAPGVVRYWAEQYKSKKERESKFDTKAMRKYLEALNTCDLMEEWYKQHNHDKQIELTYFKLNSGKYYSTGAYEPKATHLYDIVAEIKQLKANKTLPGLVEGADEFSIHFIACGVPHIIY